MVSAVTSNPYYSYLNQLQSSTATAAKTTASNGSGGSSTTSAAQSLVSSLLNGGSYSTSLLSLIQPSSSGSFDPITDLLGATGTNDALTSLYANVYDAAAAATLTQAQDNAAVAANTAAGTSSGSGVSTPTTAQSLINSFTQASVAYNQTIQQNAASVLAANSYGPDGVTKLVS